jgi:hypothetical protein
LTYEVHHSPNEGYLAYLLTGDYWHYETMAMSASYAYFGLSSARGSGVNRLHIQDQIRGIAWAFRTVGCFVGVAPSGDAIASDYRTWLSTGHCTHWANMGPYNVSAKQLGYPFAISTYNPAAKLSQAPWMMHFWIQAQGFVSDIDPGFTSNTDFHALRDWMYKGAVGILGGNNTTEYCYTKAGNYNITLSDDIVANFAWTTPDRFYATWGEVYTATHGVPNTSCGSTLEGTSGGDPSAASTGYWGNLMPAIAYAVDHGATGAQTAWNRLTSATNWSAVTGSGFDNIPIWGVRPRDEVTIPAWVSALPLWQWYQIPNTAMSSLDPSGVPQPWYQAGGPSAKVGAWNGAALRRNGSVYIVGMVGGHNDYAGNEVDILVLNTATPQWARLKDRPAGGDLLNASPYNLDLSGASSHTYYYLQFIESQNRFVSFCNGGMGSATLPAPPGGWLYVSKRACTSINYGTASWDAPSTIQDYPNNTGDWTAALCCKHPTADDVYVSRSGGAGWYRWAAATNTWALLSGTVETNYCGAAIDTTRDRVLIVGDYSGTINPRVRNLDGTTVSASFTGSSLQMSGYPGVVYDEENDSFLVFKNDNPISIYRVNPSTWVVDQPTITGTAPAQRPNGIQNSCQYVPELKGIVIANTYTGNVYFMRTAL